MKLNYDLIAARLDEMSPSNYRYSINLSAIKASRQVATKMGLKYRDSLVKKKSTLEKICAC